MTLKQRLARIAALELPEQDKRILRYIAWRIGKNDYCYRLPVYVVASACRMREKTVQATLHFLYNLDFITVYDEPGKANSYSLDLPRAVKKRMGQP